MNLEAAAHFVAARWRDSVVPALCDYIRIPNQSPAFDPDWAEHGHMERAIELVLAWVRAQELRDTSIEVVRLPNRTPVILVEVAGQRPETVLLYGHLDKQPPFAGWAEGLDPWTPVLRDGRLYGRGAADDGYAAFAAITAIKALQEQGVAHARCVVLIEACEESGSYDLPHYLRAAADRIGKPSLVIGLDSGCGDYQRLWVTSSLRGLVNGDLQVAVLRDGVHSGNGGGIVPSSFRILRHLLDRIEDAATGAIRLPEANVAIPGDIIAQAQAAARVLGERTHSEYPYAAGTRPMAKDPAELVLNRTWRPQLEVIGAAGLPELGHCGNVLRPSTTVRLSLRLPPTADAGAASMALKRTLEADPPYGAQVKFTVDSFGSSGWKSPALAPWLEQAIAESSQALFGNEPCAMGEGGTIPFMTMLGEMFPQAQFLITGVLGPQSNAHGPNEFLELKTAERLTAAVANVLARHASAPL
ncbi:MAG TPA: M20/M25/M40 family metallo-hydrolase [Terriglobales bacterium]|nr:M20/M25/M40 family metallo-hydrolase [Terriglobales bacterium]